MKVECVNSQNNFGWNAAIHGKITRAALEHVPVLSVYKTPIIEGAYFPLPNFRFGHIVCPKHCYYGQSLSEYQTGPKHAFDLYEGKLKDSVIDWEFDDENIAMRKLGEALHFLQDVADPFHTQKGQNTLLNYFKFKKYNKYASEVDIDKLIAGKSGNATTENFYDLFGDTYFKSSNTLNPLDEKNIPFLPALVKKYIEEACSTSVAFLKRLGNLHVMTDNHKAKVIETELTNSRFFSGLNNKPEIL